MTPSMHSRTCWRKKASQPWQSVGLLLAYGESHASPAIEDRGRLLAVLRAFTPLDDNPDDSFLRLGLAFFHDSNGVRIDVLLADTVFDETAIERARVVTLFKGKTIRVCTAEVLVVYKMLSTRLKDRADVESVIQKRGEALDNAYIEGWLAQFEDALADSTLVQEFRNMRGRQD